MQRLFIVSLFFVVFCDPFFCSCHFIIQSLLFICFHFLYDAKGLEGVCPLLNTNFILNELKIHNPIALASVMNFSLFFFSSRKSQFQTINCPWTIALKHLKSLWLHHSVTWTFNLLLLHGDHVLMVLDKMSWVKRWKEHWNCMHLILVPSCISLSPLSSQQFDFTENLFYYLFSSSWALFLTCIAFEKK